jgi:hypothetical protein
LLELTFANETISQTQNVKNVQPNDTNVSYDFQSIINVMDAETVSQAWFRFLHIIGKPIDFCDAAVIIIQMFCVVLLDLMIYFIGNFEISGIFSHESAKRYRKHIECG